MPVSPRFPSYQARPLPRLVTGGPVHRKEILSSNRIALHCRRTGTRSPVASTPVPTTSAPNAARRCGRRSSCRRVQDRRAHARANHPTEPARGPRRVSLLVLGVSPSPENFLATPADTNANVLFPGEPRRSRAAPATTRRTPGSGPALLLDHSPAAARTRKEATSKCGTIFRALHQRPVIDPAQLARRSNA